MAVQQERVASSVPRWLLVLVLVGLVVPPSSWTAERDWPPGDTFSTTLDPWLSFPTAVSLVTDGDVDLAEHRSSVGHYALHEMDDGALVDHSPWFSALLLVPPVVMLEILQGVGLGDGAGAVVAERGWGPIQLAVAAAVVVVSVALVWRLCIALGLHRRETVLLTLAWAMGSMVWSVAGRGLWQHTVLLVPLLVLVELIRRADVGSADRRSLAVAGVAAAVAVLIRPAVAPMVGILIVWLALRVGRSAVWVVAAGLGTLMLGGGLSWALYDGLPPYLSQRGRLGMHDDSLVAILSLIASPSRNAVLFAPVLFLATIGGVHAWRRGRSSFVSMTFVALLVQLVVSTGLWDGWSGGFSYGPRFVVDVLPVALVPAAAAVRQLRHAGEANRALVVVLTVGVLVNAPGALTHQAGCWNLALDPEHQAKHVFDYRRSQFVEGYQQLVEHGADALVGPCDA